MATNKLINESCYKGSCIFLTTKHAKSIAIAPPFLETLGASIDKATIFLYLIT